MDKIKAAVIYLASGNSKRFGQENKLLQMIGTKPMYRYGLDRLIDLCKDHEGFEIIVVTQYQEIMKQTQYDPITTVFCPESKYGISWSIKAGIKAAKDAEFYTFFVADQPNMKRETIERFLSFYKLCNGIIQCFDCCCFFFNGCIFYVFFEDFLATLIFCKR